MSSYEWPTTAAPNHGVTSVNGLTGAITLAAGANITLTPSGNTITISGTGGGGGVTLVGTIDSQTASSDGLVISGSSIYAQSASSSNPGLVNNTTQTFAGQKTFSTGLTGTLTGAASLNVLTSALGNLTDAGTDGIVITGGTGATVGAVSLAQHVADTTHNGYLSSIDWNIFNGKQATGNFATSGSGDVTWPAPSGAGPVTTTLAATTNATLTTLSALSLPATQLSGTIPAARMPAFTGDVTTSAGAVATTLATVNSNVGSFGSSTSIPSFTVNGKGLLTAASGNVVIAPAGTLSGTTLNSSVVSSSLTSVGTIATGVWNGTTIAIANGGTGQTAKTAAFDALQPMTTGGDIIYGGASGTGTRLANGSANQYLASAGSTSAPVWTSFVAPTTQTFTSGSATYTTPTSPRSPLYIDVFVVGPGGSGGGAANIAAPGGGGGGGSGGYVYKRITSILSTYAVVVGAGGSGAASAGNGSAGSADTTFGTSFLTAGKGSGGSAGGAGTGLPGNGGGGGTATGGDINIAGQAGGGGTVGFTATQNGDGGLGGSNPLGFGGAMIISGSNSGTGYGAGSSGGAGSNNGTSTAQSGVIIVREYYQ